ncbi:MAG: DUF4244 domain-containing protein [Actinomycetota bacterium]
MTHDVPTDHSTADGDDAAEGVPTADVGVAPAGPGACCAHQQYRRAPSPTVPAGSALRGSRCPLRPTSLAARPAVGWPPPAPAVYRRRESPGPTAETGQATAEYALVMLAAAALAGLLLAWASSTDGVGRLFDAVLDSLLTQV